MMLHRIFLILTGSFRSRCECIHLHHCKLHINNYAYRCYILDIIVLFVNVMRLAQSMVLLFLRDLLLRFPFSFCIAHQNTGISLMSLIQIGLILKITYKKLVIFRFSPENKEGRNPMSYIPFGWGQRSCIGMRFALLEAKACLVNVLRKYRFERSPDTQVSVWMEYISTI